LEFTESKSISYIHTSLIDSTLNLQFVSCLTGKPISSDLWGGGEPNNMDKTEACVVANLGGGVYDTSCQYIAAPVCEVLYALNIVEDKK
jgi:hypothetical protein